MEINALKVCVMLTLQTNQSFIKLCRVLSKQQPGEPAFQLQPITVVWPVNSSTVTKLHWSQVLSVVLHVLSAAAGMCSSPALWLQTSHMSTYRDPTYHKFLPLWPHSEKNGHSWQGHLSRAFYSKAWLWSGSKVNVLRHESFTKLWFLFAGRWCQSTDNIPGSAWIHGHVLKLLLELWE